MSKSVAKGNSFSANRIRNEKPKFQQKGKQAVTLVTNKLPTEKAIKCQICSQGHKLQGCPEFKKLIIDECYQITSRHRLCLVCFRSNHWASKCPSKCSICHGQHNNLLYRDDTHSKKVSIGNTSTLLLLIYYNYTHIGFVGHSISICVRCRRMSTASLCVD